MDEHAISTYDVQSLTKIFYFYIDYLLITIKFNDEFIMDVGCFLTYEIFFYKSLVSTLGLTLILTLGSTLIYLLSNLLLTWVSTLVDILVLTWV